MFCFHNLPHKGAKGQSQRQRHELARTSGQIARLAYRGREHTPSYPEPSCGFLLPFCPHCHRLMPLPPKGSGRHGHSPPGRNLSSAHPRRALSNITLLFQTHQGRCWTPATEPQIPPFPCTPRTLGHFPPQPTCLKTQAHSMEWRGPQSPSEWVGA